MPLKRGYYLDIEILISIFYIPKGIKKHIEKAGFAADLADAPKGFIKRAFFYLKQKSQPRANPFSGWPPGGPKKGPPGGLRGGRPSPRARPRGPPAGPEKKNKAKNRARLLLRRRRLPRRFFFGLKTQPVNPGSWGPEFTGLISSIYKKSFFFGFQF